MSITVLLVDDHPLIRDAIIELLALEKDIAVIAQAADGTQALRLAVELKPDTIVLDIGLPDINGLVVAERLKTQSPPPRIIIVSAQLEPATVRKAWQAGAMSVIPKDQIFEHLPQAIRSIALNRQYILPGVDS